MSNSFVHDPLPSVEEVAAKLSASQQAEKIAAHKAASEAPAETPQEEAPAAPQETQPDLSTPTADGVDPAPETSVVSVEPEKVEEKPQDRTASRFAALSRKEREIRAQQKAMADRQKEIDAKEARLAALSEKESRFDQIKKSPMKFLKEYGLSLSDVAADATGTYEEPKLDPIEERFRAIEAKAARVEELEKELARRDEGERVRQWNPPSRKSLKPLKKLSRMTDMNLPGNMATKPYP